MEQLQASSHIVAIRLFAEDGLEKIIERNAIRASVAIRLFAEDGLEQFALTGGVKALLVAIRLFAEDGLEAFGKIVFDDFGSSQSAFSQRMV